MDAILVAVTQFAQTKIHTAVCHSNIPHYNQWSFANIISYEETDREGHHGPCSSPPPVTSAFPSSSLHTAYFTAPQPLEVEDAQPSLAAGARVGLSKIPGFKYTGRGTFSFGGEYVLTCVLRLVCSVWMENDDTSLGSQRQLPQTISQREPEIWN